MESFAAIRRRAELRKGGEDVLARLLGAPPDNAKLASLADDRILSQMAARIFSAGFVWRVIEAKWPGFEAAFFARPAVADFVSSLLRAFAAAGAFFFADRTSAALMAIWYDLRTREEASSPSSAAVSGKLQ